MQLFGKNASGGEKFAVINICIRNPILRKLIRLYNLIAAGKPPAEVRVQQQQFTEGSLNLLQSFLKRANVYKALTLFYIYNRMP